ncbi:MAG: 2,3-dimethylmalate dehydratase large subunit [bacterium ADurb.Bin429]|nr:MAG: 2,3-dimethylmalate dehydratase large subunit [bacterium ADurb.Bin429]
MGMTITEKILAAHAGKAEVQPGEFVRCALDFVLGNDITAPLAINEFEKMGATAVFDRERIGLIPDHSTPNKDIKAAQLVKQMREFAQAHGITNYFEVGRMGVEHALLPEQGLVVPGDCIIGADSHTCTYGALGAFSTGVGSTDLAAAIALGETWFRVPESMKFHFFGPLRPWVSGKDLILYTIGKIGVDGARYRAMEFCGEAIEALGMADRMAICNMAIEAGGKNGIIAPDAITRAYVEGRAKRPFTFYTSDADARYLETFEWDCRAIEPQVSFPFLPSNTKSISDAVALNVAIQQSIVGSCTNGRIEDLRVTAAILKGRMVHPDVRMIIIPATQEIWKAAVQEGLMEIFVDAGAAVSTPTCGPCLGGHMGILAEGERAVATTNRNFVGRMGHPKSEVYLASPAIAAASAILGRLGSPEELGVTPEEFTAFCARFA